MKIILPNSAVQLAGYSELITRYALSIPLPDRLFAIGKKHRVCSVDEWTLLTPRHKPADSLFGHLVFALKHEGIHLWVLKALFDALPLREIEALVLLEPTGAYARRIWFLYEWLTGNTLSLPDTVSGGYVNLVNDKLQYAGPIRKCKRQRVNNNLPGNHHFCPLIRKTDLLENWWQNDLLDETRKALGQCHPDVLTRAASFLLLADSKASFSIEGEQPSRNRIERWGQVIGMAGQQSLSVEELERLQGLVLADYRFVIPGLRVTGGFIGSHDRVTGMPLPEHISARPEDLPELMHGLLETYSLLKGTGFPPVLLAAMIAFGFVFIHPFEDGNGRLHRYLIHHVLAETGFVPKGWVFPVSAVILERIVQYREVLQAYSKPRLEFVEWFPTPNNNVSVVNETKELYRYFDATRQAEFLVECVVETIRDVLPEEVAYLQQYDVFVGYVNDRIDMPQRTADLLLRFLQQNQGTLSKRALNNEFAQLKVDEVNDIEEKYQMLFQDSSKKLKH